MVKVDLEAEFNEKHFYECIAEAECFEPKVTLFPEADVNTIVTERFAQNSPEGLAYITTRSFTNTQMNELLAWMEDQQADGEYAAEYFLKNYQSTWVKWLNFEAQNKIKKALADID